MTASVDTNISTENKGNVKNTSADESQPNDPKLVLENIMKVS